MRPATLLLVALLAVAGWLSLSAGTPGADAAGIGFLPGEAGFRVRAIADGGATATQAGLHPYQLDLGMDFGGGLDPREVAVDLPPGLLLDPAAVGACGRREFATPRSSPFEASRSGESCPDLSQIGTAELRTSGGGAPLRFGLFNLAPGPGVAAAIGFAPYGRPVVFDITVPEGPSGTQALRLRTRELPPLLHVTGLSLSLWGAPWRTSHDGERGNCLDEAEPTFPWAKCEVQLTQGQREVAYVSLPARCAPTLPFTAMVTAWQESASAAAQALNRDPGGPPLPLGGCGALEPQATVTGLLNDTKASSPSGYHLSLLGEPATLTNPARLLTPSVRRLTLALPPGVSLNPSVGAGLEGCSPGGFAAETAASAAGEGCPNGSKIGEFSATSPLFAAKERFAGSIYLATPGQNPSGSLIAFYLVAKLPARGVQVKLPGRIDADPVSGDLTAVVEDLPQLPYTGLELDFRAGQRALLVTPASCGPATSTVTMTTWAEGTRPLTGSVDSPIQTGIDGGPCPSGTPPFHPGVVAGGYNSNVGSYTPYFVHITRRDTESELTSYSLDLPKGITAKLAGIPFCPDAAIAAARSRSGTEEAASPSCPAASQVGRTLSGYGVGNALTYAAGAIYLAGPYHGAPLSLVTIDPATVGPFDLGTIVIRSAFQIGPLTAQLRIDPGASDPIPHILGGVPLHLRDVRIYIDRPEFTHNPTSCEPSRLESTLTGSGADFGSAADDQSASATSYFQLLNCLTLGFHPKLGIRLRGGSRRGAFPSLRATFASRGAQDSNLKRLEVTMPHSEFLAQAHIRAICTRPQFAAERCPKGSAYGQAVAYTPLFDAPLRGTVYLRSSDTTLPDMAATLRSGSIRIDLSGRIEPAKGGIRVFFDELPDAPISRFVMTLFGGRRGLLVNSTDICASPPLATVRALGQNDRGASFTSRLRGECGGKRHAHKKHHHQKKKQKHHRQHRATRQKGSSS
ncbi:MAG TPA: hypothetical protein VMF55_04400 [Solirubrobacterales bacterium]|nr:hypothetical protein [Solirubrobacterales bacterium]